MQTKEEYKQFLISGISSIYRTTIISPIIWADVSKAFASKSFDEYIANDGRLKLDLDYFFLKRLLVVVDFIPTV